MKRALTFASLLVSIGSATAQVTISQDSAFGTNGQTIGAAVGLGSSSTERGMAYNSTTKKVYVLSRSSLSGKSAPVVNIYNGKTGALENTVSIASQVTGGTFTANTIRVSKDGQIFVANLTANASTSNFKVYKFANEAALTSGSSTTFFDGALDANRLGDSLDLYGTGNNVELIAGYAGQKGYARITSSGGTSIGAGVAGINAGDYRLGITYGGTGTGAFGTQGGSLRYVDFSGASTTFTLQNGSWAAGERLIDVGKFGQYTYLASVDAGSNVVKVWQQTNATTLALRTSINPTWTDVSNGNATGAIQWGDYDGTTHTASLYVLNTNNGLAKFNVTPVPEPASMAVVGLGLLAMMRRRRR